MAEQLSGAEPNQPTPGAAASGEADSTARKPQAAPTIYSLSGDSVNLSAPAMRASSPPPRPQMARTAMQVEPALTLRRIIPGGPPLVRPIAPLRPSYRPEGMICLIVAIGWGLGAQYCYKEIGTLMLFNALSGVMKLQPSPPPSAASGGAAAPRGMQQTLSLFPPANPPQAGPRSINKREVAGSERRTAITTMVRPRPTEREREEEERRFAQSLERGEITRIAWAVATFLLTGLITAVALACLFRTTAGRLPPFALVCTALGACVGGLAAARYTLPPREGDTWLSWIIAITQSRYSWAGHLTIAALMAAVCGLVVLRPTSDPRRWLIAAVICMFVGAFLTLAGISALETYARFPPLPAWVYAVVAAGQSFFAWVLMVMLHWRHPVQTR